MDISPYGNFAVKLVRRMEFLPFGNFVVCVFDFQLIRCLNLFSTNVNIKQWDNDSLYTHYFIEFFIDYLTSKLKIKMCLQKKKTHTHTTIHNTPIRTPYWIRMLTSLSVFRSKPECKITWTEIFSIFKLIFFNSRTLTYDPRSKDKSAFMGLL